MSAHLSSRASIGQSDQPWNHATIRASVWLDEKDYSIKTALSVDSGAGGIAVDLSPDDALRIRDMVDEFLKNHLEISHQQAINAEGGL